MAQQQQPPSSGSNNDNSLTPVYLVLMLFLAGYFFWLYFKVYLIDFFFFINIWEAKLINLVIHSSALSNNIFIMETVDSKTLSWNQFMDISSNVGNYTRYPIIILFIGLAGWLYKSNVTMHFRRTHSMKSLRAQEQTNWPAIMPVVKEDLATADISKGPWAMALSPLEFAQKYKLLRKEDVIFDNTTSIKSNRQELIASIRRGDAKRVFTLQLGPYWEGFERCAPHVYCLVGVCLARIKRDKASATLILETLDKTFAMGKPDFSVARPIVKKYQNCEEAQEILQKHAYVLTVMASLIEMARQDGVVPSAEFLWLKSVDRRLWYMLNSIGRQTPFSEVGGPFAHWKAEKALGRRCLAPMIDEAIRALEIAIKEIKLTPKVYQELTP